MILDSFGQPARMDIAEREGLELLRRTLEDSQAARRRTVVLYGADGRALMLPTTARVGDTVSVRMPRSLSAKEVIARGERESDEQEQRREEEGRSRLLTA